MPHTKIRRVLTVAASETAVRILEGLEVVASHVRSYDKGQQIEDPLHVEALVSEKRRARKARATDRLVHAAPTIQKLLGELARRGEHLGSQTSRFLKLLELFGPERLERAAAEALAKGVVDPRSVELLLERERIEEKRPPIVPVELPDDPRVRGISVRPHELSSYGILSSEEVRDAEELG